MPTTPEEFAAHDRASVVAAAGCGKTRLIAETVKVLEGTRHLILTHTHAGVHAMQRKFVEVGVESSRVQVSTIDGFALRWAAAYPAMSGLAVSTPRDEEWKKVHPAAQRVVGRQLIVDYLRRNFDGLFVDEYQDCSVNQHRMIEAVADALPTRVVGDPLQGIFDFQPDDPIVDFDEHVFPIFEPLENLTEPHRWATSNPELGEWLGEARPALEAGETLDFNSAPIHVWPSDVPLVNAKCKEMIGEEGSVVVIRAQGAQAHAFAKRLGGRYQSMEEMECRALFTATDELDATTDAKRAAVLYEFVQKTVSGLGDTGTVGKRIQLYRDGQIPSVPNGKFSSVVSALNDFAITGEAGHGRLALRRLVDASASKPFRLELLGEMDRTLANAAQHPEWNLSEAAWRTRDVTRRRGRRPWRLSVGRTLLVKGLEYEHAVVMDVAQLAPKHLYVALTRGAQSLAVVLPD